MKEKVITFSAEELLAIQLLVAVGVTGLTTPAGPAHMIKRRMETNHGHEISLDHLQAVMRKVSGESDTQTHRNTETRTEK